MEGSRAWYPPGGGARRHPGPDVDSARSVTVRLTGYIHFSVARVQRSYGLGPWTQKESRNRLVVLSEWALVLK